MTDRESVPKEAPEYVWEAQAEKLRAEAKHALTEAAYEELQLESRKLELELERRKFAEIQAGNPYHHVYRFDTEVGPKSVAACLNQLDTWDRIDPDCDMTIIFTSPGGGVVDGMALWDHLQMIRDKGHKLYTHTEGMAASMAGILLQAGDVRSMGKESYILIHEIQAVAMGSWGELEDRMKWLEKIQKRILDIFATRSSAITGKDFSRTRKMLEHNWKRTDWWIDSDEALKIGLVDEVR